MALYFYTDKMPCLPKKNPKAPACKRSIHPPALRRGADTCSSSPGPPSRGMRPRSARLRSICAGRQCV